MARSGGAVVRTPAKSFCSDAGVLDFRLQLRDVTQLPKRGTSGSVQRGPANPARPGREQRYRERLGCRRSPEVPRVLVWLLYSIFELRAHDSQSSSWPIKS